MTPTFKQIEPYLEKRLISMHSLPENANIAIFNYTEKCQFEKAWDSVTMACRGLIMDVVTGEVLANPLPKFFNYEEWVALGNKIPDEKPVVYEKFDGSLGILFWYNGEPRIATRGSFVSEQAKWATEWLKSSGVNIKEFKKDCTFLFEIIYPENRIVVNYPYSGLVLLAVRDTKTGGEYLSNPFVSRGAIRMADPLNENDVESLLKEDKHNYEGYVLHWPKQDLRLKIKLPEYKRLHRLITGVSVLSIWEILRDGKNVDEIIENVPDEFHKWVTDTRDELMKQYLETLLIGQRGFDSAEILTMKTRKEQALHIQKTTPEDYRDIAFSVLNNQPERMAQVAWNLIRPTANKLFKKDPQ